MALSFGLAVVSMFHIGPNVLIISNRPLLISLTPSFETHPKRHVGLLQVSFQSTKLYHMYHSFIAYVQRQQRTCRPKHLAMMTSRKSRKMSKISTTTNWSRGMTSMLSRMNLMKIPYWSTWLMLMPTSNLMYSRSKSHIMPFWKCFFSILTVDKCTALDVHYVELCIE